MEDGKVDLELLGLRSGQATRELLHLEPDAPRVGGQAYPVSAGPVEATIEISRTLSGWALRLRATVVIGGPCARCLEPAALELAIGSREVDQPRADDPELRSPYVEDGVLDAYAWLRDSIALALPKKVLCRPDCAGLCPECGVSLNDVGPDGHSHERPPDPRFAKLRELIEDEQ